MLPFAVDEAEVGKLVCRMVSLACRRAEVRAYVLMERRQECTPSMVGRKEDGVPRHVWLL
jgi:hypothetical protein